MKGNSRLIGSVLFFLFLIGTTMAGQLPVMVIVIYSVASLASLGIYAWDKSAARNNRQRTPENTLHALALIGGWPGALAAQKLFRHKSRKQSFQLVFWMTVVANCAALFLLFTQDGVTFLDSLRSTAILLHSQYSGQ